MPTETDVDAVLNLTWQEGHDAVALRAACEGAIRIHVCEVRGPHGEMLDLRGYLPDGWATNQDLTDRDKSMSAVCWRTDAVRLVALHPPVLLSHAGRGVNARYLSWCELEEIATGEVTPEGAAHSPLAKTGRKLGWYLRLRSFLRAHPRARIGCDGNDRDMRRVKRRLARSVIGREVMFLTVPRGRAPKQISTVRTIGSDHPILRVVLRRVTRPIRRKKARR